MKVIIDTNVMMVANHQNTEVTSMCQEVCVEFLIKARADYVVLIDSGDEIRSEYARALQDRRPYQLGALFLQHILQHQWDANRVRRVDLEKTKVGAFTDFPDDPELSSFDLSDRKFVALAKKTKVAVTNAVDSDWVDSLHALNMNGIEVNFLCGRDKSKWLVV
jgi:hypothetical protein